MGVRRRCCEGRTPWERGKRAVAVKPDAMRRLGSALRRFARHCSVAIGASDERRDFKADALQLVQLDECWAWVAGVCSERPGLAPCDAEAAIASAYVEVVTVSFGGLYLAYRDEIAELLRRSLRPTLRAVHLEMPARELYEDVLRPMAAFFLDAVRTLESDPNRLSWQPRNGRPLRKRPYGWSAGCDPLGTSLSLLLTRQGGGMRWSKALIHSPFGYCLRAAGLAVIHYPEQRFCGTCRKYISGPAIRETCPECGGRLMVTRPPRLLARRFVHGLREDAAAPSENAERRPRDEPSREPERMEGRRRDRRTALRHARDLWHSTMRGRLRDLRRMAVLLGLTGLENMPGPREWKTPKPCWLRGIVTRLGMKSLKGDGLARRSRRMLAQIAEILHLGKSPGLTDGNVRTIVSKFRRLL